MSTEHSRPGGEQSSIEQPRPGGEQSSIEPAEAVRRAAITVGALAQNGLTYAESDYDRDRYRQLASLSADLLSAISGRSAAQWQLELGQDVGYTTPKVDVRAAIFDSDDRVLLMRERSDGLWSLPGGWADPLDSPAAAAVREVAEETGYQAEAVKVVAVFDREAQGHLPKLPVHVYKLFFLCRLLTGHKDASPLETLEVGWFSLAQLPELSTGRVHHTQLELALAHHHDPTLPTYFD